MNKLIDGWLSEIFYCLLMLFFPPRVWYKGIELMVMAYWGWLALFTWTSSKVNINWIHVLVLRFQRRKKNFTLWLYWQQWVRPLLFVWHVPSINMNTLNTYNQKPALRSVSNSASVLFTGKCFRLSLCTSTVPWFFSLTFWHLVIVLLSNVLRHFTVRMNF